MPIYDFNGTTKQEVNKVYVRDGTSRIQIGKMYDNNGTSRNLIYNSELIIIQSSAWQNSYSYTNYQTNWLSSIGGTQVHQRRPDQGSSGHYSTAAYVKLPTSNYDTLTMTYYCTATGEAGGIYGGAAAALRSNLVTLNQSSSMSTLTSGAAYSCGNTWGGSTSSATVTWDISSIASDYYLEVGAYQYGWASESYATGSYFGITSLILT